MYVCVYVSKIIRKMFEFLKFDKNFKSIRKTA